MRNLFIISFLANIILAIALLFIFPSDVAVHFGRGGAANAWVPKELYIVYLGIIEIPLFFLIFFIPSLTFRVPDKFISLPNKAYWLRPEHRQRAQQKLQSLMFDFGFVNFTFLFCVGFMVLAANVAQPVQLNEGIFYAVFIAFMIYIVYWCVKVFLAFKVPK